MRTAIAEIGCAAIFFICMILMLVGFTADDRRQQLQVIPYIETGIMEEAR